MSQWRKLSEEEPWVTERTLTLVDNAAEEVHFLTERIDWEGNVVEREGDERLMPIVEISLKIQELAPKDFDEAKIKKEAAPIIQRVMAEITGNTVDIEDIEDSMEIEMDGTWSASPPNRNWQNAPKRLH